MAKKILLAEDSVTMQKVVQMTFAAEDFTVTAVSSGDEAVTRAKELKPDVVIADLSMEGKNGYDICREIKADPALASIQVLILHGSAAPYDEAKGKSAKVDGEITKPFETQAFIDRVTELSERVAATPKEDIGRVESLAPPIGEDIVIDTEAMAEPEKPAVARPAAPPAKPAVPAVKPAAPKPAVPRPPAAPKPAVPKPAAPALKPAVPKPAAPKPAAPKPPPAAVKPPPAAPKPPPAVVKPPVEPEPEPVEITIEAEPPPLHEGSGMRSFEVPSFDRPLDEPLAVEARKVEVKDNVTLMGLGRPVAPPTPVPVLKPMAPKPEPKPEVIVAPPRSAAATPATPVLPTVTQPGLPPPPPGLPLPSKPARVPPVTPGEPYEPAAYEAIAKLSREIIERIAWEVVPDLAEQIIREEIDRLIEKRKSG